jgi:hypothetical protein
MTETSTAPALIVSGYTTTGSARYVTGELEEVRVVGPTMFLAMVRLLPHSVEQVGAETALLRVRRTDVADGVDHMNRCLVTEIANDPAHENYRATMLDQRDAGVALLGQPLTA